MMRGPETEGGRVAKLLDQRAWEMRACGGWTGGE